MFFSLYRWCRLDTRTSQGCRLISIIIKNDLTVSKSLLHQKLLLQCSEICCVWLGSSDCLRWSRGGTPSNPNTKYMFSLWRVNEVRTSYEEYLEVVFRASHGCPPSSPTRARIGQVSIFILIDSRSILSLKLPTPLQAVVLSIEG